jgi:hypothetical protein
VVVSISSAPMRTAATVPRPGRCTAGGSEAFALVLVEAGPGAARRRPAGRRRPHRRPGHPRRLRLFGAFTALVALAALTGTPATGTATLFEAGRDGQLAVLERNVGDRLDLRTSSAVERPSAKPTLPITRARTTTRPPPSTPGCSRRSGRCQFRRRRPLGGRRLGVVVCHVLLTRGCPSGVECSLSRA